MSIGPSATLANSYLDALGNNTSFTVATPYIKLHIGDPGAAGTANPAVETTRKLISFGAASAGSMTNDAQLQWTAVAASEDYTHFSIWSAAAAGTFYLSGTITTNAVTAGDTFNIPVDILTLTAGPVAA